MANVEDITLMHKYQADILTEETTNNPLIPSSRFAKKNKQLRTESKFVTGAINEIKDTFADLEKSTVSRLNERLFLLGDYPNKPDIVTGLKAIDNSIIEAIIKIYKDLNGEDLEHPEDIAEIAPSVKEALLMFFEDHKEKKVYNFKEKFQASEATNLAQFKLQHIPIESTIRMQVNGVYYDCAYLPERQCVEWIFTEENGGFNLDPSYSVTVFYDYLVSEQDKKEK